MTFAATGRAQRYAFCTAAALALSSGAWSQPLERSAVVVAMPPAAATIPMQIASAKTGPAGDEVSSDESAHRRLMLLMLIDRVRTVGPFGSLGQ